MSDREILGLRLYDALHLRGRTDNEIAYICEVIESGGDLTVSGSPSVSHTPIDWDAMRTFGVSDYVMQTLSENRIRTIEMLRLLSKTDLTKLRGVGWLKAGRIQAYLEKAVGAQLRPENEPFVKYARYIYDDLLELVPAAAIMIQVFTTSPDIVVYEVLEKNGWVTVGRLVRATESELQLHFPESWYVANILQWERKHGLIPPKD